MIEESGSRRKQGTTMLSRCMTWAKMGQLPLLVMCLLLVTCNEVTASASYASVSFVTSVPSSASHVLPYTDTLSPSLLTASSSSSSHKPHPRVAIAISQLKHRTLNSSFSHIDASLSTTTPASPAASLESGFPTADTYAAASSEDLVLNIAASHAAANHSNHSMSSQRPYFGDFFYTILDAYYPVHGYLSLLVCIFGIFANILNIVVLTR